MKTICLNISSLDIPIIAGQEVYYLEQNIAEAHDALVCIGNKQFLDDDKIDLNIATNII